MHLIKKHFKTLTTTDLHAIYKLRISVFVVEQNCPYQEVDDADKQIVKEAIKTAKEEFNAKTIKIEAQVYAKELYEKVGFVQKSEPFLEDGIPHILMEYTE